MGPRTTTFFTVISLIFLQIFFPLLLQHWLFTIAEALPSFFTLGITTFLLYKSYRYPRGTIFSILGLSQIAFTSWVVFYFWKSGLILIAIPILLAAIFFAPRSAKLTWNWLGVDRYYDKKYID